MSWGLFLTPACKNIFPKADVLIPTTANSSHRFLTFSELASCGTSLSLKPWVLFEVGIESLLTQTFPVRSDMLPDPTSCSSLKVETSQRTTKEGWGRQLQGFVARGSDPRQSQFCQVPLWKWTYLASTWERLMSELCFGCLLLLPFLWASGFSLWDSLSFLLSFLFLEDSPFVDLLRSFLLLES